MGRRGPNKPGPTFWSLFTGFRVEGSGDALGIQPRGGAVTSTVLRMEHSKEPTTELRWLVLILWRCHRDTTHVPGDLRDGPKNTVEPYMVAYAYNPRTWEGET